MISKNNTQSLPNLLETLWHQDFFSKAKGIMEIDSNLGAKGYNFTSSVLSMALLRLVKRKGFLNRIKNQGKWKYIQKYPVSIKSNIKLKLLENYDFHPKIKKVSIKQFEDGYFKEAIQNAFVEVIDQVKIKTGNPKSTNGRDLDGDDLMNHVFGCDNQQPKIKFNSLSSSLDKAEQRGLMNLFKGIVGVRDKKAHMNFVQNDFLKAIEYLSLASLLMRLLEENTTA